MAVEFRWNNSVSRIIDDTIKRKETLLFMAATWNRLYNKFVPMYTGTLANYDIDIYVECDEGVIHHTAPYADKMYYGVGFNFSKEEHPLASAKWDEAAKAAGKKEDLIKDVEAFIKRGGG